MSVQASTSSFELRKTLPRLCDNNDLWASVFNKPAAFGVTTIPVLRCLTWSLSCPCLQRVSTLLADNRRLRRQAMQLQLQAGTTAADSNTAGTADSQAHPQGSQDAVDALSLAAAAGPASSQQQQQQLVAVDAMQDAAVVAAETEADRAAAAAEALALRNSLEAAEQHVLVLTDENERLMELSNGLRAECDGLKKALNLQVHTVCLGLE